MVIKKSIIAFSFLFLCQSAFAERLVVVFCLYGNDWPHTQHIHSHLYRLDEQGKNKEGAILNLWGGPGKGFSVKGILYNEKAAWKVHGFEFEGDYEDIYKKWKKERDRKILGGLANVITNNCADDIYSFVKRVLKVRQPPSFFSWLDISSIKFTPRIPLITFKHVVKILSKNKNRFKDLGTKTKSWTP